MINKQKKASLNGLQNSSKHFNSVHFVLKKAKEILNSSADY